MFYGSRLQYLGCYFLALETMINLTTAHKTSDDAMPMPTSSSSPSRKNAQMSSTANGSRNWVIANNTVFLLNFPPVTAPVNFINKKNCMTPATTPIETPSIFQSTPIHAYHFTPKM